MFFYQEKSAADEIRFSKEFLTHPQRSSLMRRFDFQWEKAHKLLPQLCYRIRDVEPSEVLEAYDSVLEFIEAMTDWRMRHSPRPFLNPLAYAHFLAGVLAVSWIDAADARNLGWYGANMRRSLAPMLQASLDHFTMAGDLEPQFDARFHKTDRSSYGRAVTACALAEVTATAFRFKAFLPIGAAPFMQQDMIRTFELYRDEALALTEDMAVDGTDWLRLCALGLEQFAIPKCNEKTEWPKQFDQFGVTECDIKWHLQDGARLRLFYLWSRMHKAYREIEGFEYGKAAMTTPNGHFPEIMPLLPHGTCVANQVINSERLYIEKERARGFDFDGLKSVNCGAVMDKRLVVGMIFDAPLLQLDGLFRRALYHGRALNEREQPEACQEAAAAALVLLDDLDMKDEHTALYRINLTALLARAINALQDAKTYAPQTARGVLEGIDIDALRSLPLKDRWFFHHVAAGLIGGTHKSLATRGRKLALAQDVPKSRGPVSDARMLLALLARETG